MLQRTPEEVDLMQRAARYMPGATTGNLELDPDHLVIIREGKGSRVRDVGGREYIDYLMGSGPVVLGHAHPAVVSAVVEAVEQGSTFFATNERAVLLAEQISLAVKSAEKVRFTTSGTDANFMALRAARAFRKRDKIVKFEGAYHGTSDYAVMSVTTPASALRDFPEAVPNAGGVPRAIVDTVLMAPYNDAEAATALIEKHHDELAAVIVEPMQRIIQPKPGFLQALRDVTAHYEIPLIFDEVVTGFRLAYGGAQELYGVTPDMSALGKIVGGGYPLAAVVGREEIMSVFDPSEADPGAFIRQVGTLNANPVACAAGLATLAELRKEGTYERLYATGRRLRDALERLFNESEIPFQPGGEDSIFGFYLTDQPVGNYRDTLGADKEMLGQFNARLLEKGILKAWPDKFYPSLAHDTEDVDRTIEVFTSTVEEIKG